MKRRSAARFRDIDERRIHFADRDQEVSLPELSHISDIESNTGNISRESHAFHAKLNVVRSGSDSAGS
ncbi:unknown [Sutterella sp. CAG:351]|nr:unknown [Sutterella sp. CAG:351]